MDLHGVEQWVGRRCLLWFVYTPMSLSNHTYCIDLITPTSYSQDTIHIMSSDTRTDVIDTALVGNRMGDNEDLSDSDDSLFEAFNKQIIEDVVVGHDAISSKSWFDNPREIQNMDKEVLMGLIELRKVEIQSQLELESKKVEQEIKKIDVELKRIRVETDLLHAEAVPLTTQTAATNTKKRVAPTQIDDHWLETQSDANWNGMVSLSSPFWKLRPVDCVVGIHEVYKMLSDHIRHIKRISNVHYGLRALSKTKDILVYVKPEIPIVRHVQYLWRAICWNNANLPIASDKRSSIDP